MTDIKNDPVEFINVMFDEMTKLYPWQEEAMRQMMSGYGTAAVHVTPTGRITFPKLELTELATEFREKRYVAIGGEIAWTDVDYSIVEERIMSHYANPPPMDPPLSKKFLEIEEPKAGVNRKARRAQAARERRK